MFSVYPSVHSPLYLQNGLMYFSESDNNQLTASADDPDDSEKVIGSKIKVTEDIFQKHFHNIIICIEFQL